MRIPLIHICKTNVIRLLELNVNRSCVVTNHYRQNLVLNTTSQLKRALLKEGMKLKKNYWKEREERSTPTSFCKQF